jgi:hypothetical protein
VINRVFYNTTNFWFFTKPTRQFVVEIVREELKVQLDIRLNRLVRNIVGREVKRALDKDDAS